ncbi:MFS transporter [Staphylothermus hellenicus]|uniref:Major facilitator superfamily MFS_1 n=1 Tax=Staphylothermus hellenicus (strain DSM 12710 / JCM 10830 / BK20S6-10-b1 / P8) TaxID=591019 RepID=D7D8R6_STAHD|nr:MFS transporter [Staphylothermus hellenicus]ADI32162.1 major facilitator superfamily MFS_1 [Staphylothermus hellenicus DSM 12710]
MYLRKSLSVILLVLIAVFFMADQNLLPPNYQYIMREFGISEVQMGLVSSIFVATSAVITILWGFLADIASRKKLLLIGVYLGEIPCFLTAFVTSYWQLLFLRLLTGIGIGSIIPIAYTLIADMYEEARRGRGYGYIETSFGAGTLVGMILAGIISNWRPPFIYVSVPNWILAPLFYIVFEEPKKGSGEKVLREAYEKGVEYTYKISLAAVKKSFETVTNILIFIQGIIGTIPWGVLVYWIVSFLMVARGMSKETATMVLLLLGIATVIGGLMGGFLGDFAERKKRGGRAILTGLAIFAGMLVTIYLLIYPLPSNPTFLDWVFLGLYSIGLIQLISYAGPNVRAIISQVNLPEDRGTVFGIFNILDNVGRAIGPVFGGALIEYFRSIGYSNPDAYLWALIVSALFWIPCSLIWIFIYKKYPEDRDEIIRILEERVKVLSKAR